jgi:hypothetical protein
MIYDFTAGQGPATEQVTLAGTNMTGTARPAISFVGNDGHSYTVSCQTWYGTSLATSSQLIQCTNPNALTFFGMQVEAVSGLVLDSLDQIGALGQTNVFTSPSIVLNGTTTAAAEFIEVVFAVTSGAGAYGSYSGSFVNGAQDVTVTIAGQQITFTQGYRIAAATGTFPVGLSNVQTSWAANESSYK